MDHSLKFPAKKIFFLQGGVPRGSETVVINPKFRFPQDLHQFVGTFSMNYL